MVHLIPIKGCSSLVLLFLVFNYFAYIECAIIKSESKLKTQEYIQNNDDNQQITQFLNDEQTRRLSPDQQPQTTHNTKIPSRILKTLHSVTNDAVPSTINQALPKNYPSPKAAPHTAERVVYGTDDRQEAVSNQSNLLKLFQADVALIATSKLTLNGWGNYDVSAAQTFTFVKGCGFVCSDEPFYNETVLANCSGVLVGTQLVATAGHCLSVNPCATTAFLFDYKQNNSMKNVSSDNVYFCSAVVSSQYTTQIDYAILQLDRPVVNRTPLPIRRVGEVSVGTPLYLVGHPLGTPMKVSGNSFVKSNNIADGFFSANTDSYDKNSGSMVVNGITWQVEVVYSFELHLTQQGLLVRGNADFDQNLTLGCCQSKVCSDTLGCNQTDGTFHFEEISKVNTFASFVPWLWNGNLSVEPSQSTVYHYGIGSVFSSDSYQYILYSQGPTNFTVSLSAPYFGPLLVNGATINSSGVLLGPDQNLTVEVEVNASFVSLWNLGDTYTLTIIFQDDLTGSITTRQHVLIITNQPSPSATPTVTATPTSSLYPSPSASSSPSNSPSPTASRTPSPTPSPSRTPSPSATPSSSATPSPYVEPAQCSPCTTNQDCTNQGICTNAGFGVTKYCSCYSGFGGCTCAEWPSTKCQASYGDVDSIAQRFRATANGTILSGNLLVNVTANLEKNQLNNSYPYSQETKIYFGATSSLYPSCNFPRQISSGGVWNQLPAQGSCVDRYNFEISWTDAKAKCGFVAITADNKTFSQTMTIVRKYALSATSFRTESIVQNITLVINEFPTNSSNVTATDVKLFAAIILIDYDANNEDWTVVVRTSLPSPYQISSASQHLLKGLLASCSRLSQSNLETVSGCTNGTSECEQNIMYTFLQGTAPHACDGLDGEIVTTANITCDDSLSASQCKTLMATVNPQVNISIELHTGDGCTVIEDIEFSKTALDSFSDSSASVPSTKFDIRDIAYFGATVESTQASITSRTLKNGSVCIRKGSVCTPVTYHELSASGGREPVFSIEFLEGNNAAAFSEGTFLVEATIEVTFQETRKRSLKTTQQMLGVNASIDISMDDSLVSGGSNSMIIGPLVIAILYLLR